MSSEPPPTRIGALRAAVSSAAFVLHRGWRWDRPGLVRLVAAAVVLAVTPALQVVAVGRLVLAAPRGLGATALPLLALVLLVGLGQTLGQTSDLTGQRTAFRLKLRFQSELMHAVARLAPQQLARPETNATIQACRDELFGMARLISATLAAVGALVTAAALCVSVSVINPVAGVLAVAALVPFLVVFGWEAQLQDRAFVELGRHERQVGYHAEQLVQLRTGTELATLGSGGRVADLLDRHQHAANRVMDRILVLLIRADALGGAASAVLLGSALLGVVVGGSSGAGIAAGVVGVLAGIAATRSAGFAFGDVVSAAPKVAAYRRFLAGVAPGSPQRIVARVDRIEVDDLVVRYPGAAGPAVNGVSLSVERGRMVALVGVNGAGKTTLVNALLGIVEVERGTVRLDGEDAARLPPAERLARFGLLTQEFGRYELTVRESVRLGSPDPDVDDERIWAALDSAHAGDLVRALPDGLDTQLGTQFGGVGLSGGQWQRLALARTYLRDAAVWVLDEPTSAIDAEAEQQIFAELGRTRSGRITVVVSHRAWTLRSMDRIYVLDHGRLVEQGRYDELLVAGGRFAEIFAEQA
ncbi:ATP-binding cassette subfamily B protein [Friedmanniella endophytica]|uniref:ATP-binding cassette subfamily B protein n=1 Tax=Microlunatus kandeliicorticis TaxID=1759536 RepID=A0A7W3IVU5_9ACTN|nr:ABC transporter ATP-binding protein [Microlunatus kandeliicorticis]MBA8796203.1 ATP-binding cassette subfamily B protein [Microlunatus kandeliicorticis]